MTNGQWELEELEAVLEPEEGTQRSVSCRWKHGGLGPMGELGARSVPGLSGLLWAARATQCIVSFSAIVQCRKKTSPSKMEERRKPLFGLTG